MTPRDVTRFVSRHPELARYKRPRYLAFTEKIPFTATGKKRYAEIRAQAAADQAGGVLKRV